MGRRRVEIKRIEDKSSRQVTFCKRRNGLMEKARQLSILCESSIALVTVSATGKLYSFSSGDSMAKILSRFEIQQAGDPKTSLVLHEKVYDMVTNLSYTKLSSRGDWHRVSLFFTAGVASEGLRQGSEGVTRNSPMVSTKTPLLPLLRKTSSK